MQKYPASIRRQLRHLRTVAFERELSRALNDLAGQFQAWHHDAITTTELRDEVHHFEVGPSRDLSNFYHRAPVDLAVAHAVARGVLCESELGDDVASRLQNVINVCRLTGV